MGFADKIFELDDPDIEDAVKDLSSYAESIEAEDQNITDQLSSWGISRNKNLENAVTFDRQHRGPFKSSKERRSARREGHTETMRSLDAGGVWAKEGMTGEEFIREWMASTPDIAPTQEDYDAWIRWGRKGKLFADRSREVSGRNIEIEIGKNKKAQLYTEKDLEFLGDEVFDWLGDNEYVILPSDTDVMGRYRAISSYSVNDEGGFSSSDDGEFTLYLKEERDKWYEDPFVAMALGTIVSLATGGIGILGNATSVSGKILAGGIQSSVGSGVTTALMGGDLADTLWKSFVTGGVSAGMAQTFDSAKYLDDLGLEGKSLELLSAGVDKSSAAAVSALLTGRDVGSAAEMAFARSVVSGITGEQILGDMVAFGYDDDLSPQDVSRLLLGVAKRSSKKQEVKTDG